MLNFAPGSRAVIRDEEWLIRRIDTTVDGGHLLTCDGVSELVRGQTKLFLTALENAIEALDPAATELVADTSPAYNATLLYLEAHLRRSAPNDAAIRLGNRAVMNTAPYQLDPALQALRQPRARILIADAVGLGKTLEAGILATELIQRGRGKRILVVTQKAMLTQFQKEWWSRFTIPLVRLDSVGLAAVRNRIPANHNPFNYFDRSIISIDTLKSNLEYRNHLENAWWDIIVIDECHNVAARAGENGLSRRARLARLLSGRSDTLILLSATPHDGSARSFASLMSLLDPTAISDPDDYTPADFRDKGLVIRRFKKDIKDQVTADFQERETVSLRQPASAAEEAAFDMLLNVRFTQTGEHKPGRHSELQRIGLQKALLSSPAAALDSTANRIKLLETKSNASFDERREIDDLIQLRDVLAPLANDPAAAYFSRYQMLLTNLRAPAFAWNPAQADDRLVIFSERIETLNWLNEHLSADLKLKPGAIAVLHGQLSDVDQQALVDRFGRADDPLRVLLCSDVASEGLNLHYFCHRLVHFDLPWSLMVFQQRNGRVDRYGQKRKPRIVYLSTESRNERVSSDLRILEILKAKDEQAYKNLGDPSAFLNVYDPDKEADKVAGFMADGRAPDAVDAELDRAAASKTDNDADPLLSLFLPESAEAAQPSSLSAVIQPLSLFSDDYRYVAIALNHIASTDDCQWSPNDAEQILALTAPPDLRERLKQLPREAQSGTDRYLLCADRARMTRAIEQARQAKAEDDTWPELQYLWPQHPVLEWLGDRVLTGFGRHRAPLLQCARLQPGEQAFILTSVIPNRKGQPMLIDWQVARRIGAGAFTLESFADFVARAGLRAGALPNSGANEHFEALRAQMQRALPEAVAVMRAHMIARQQMFDAELSVRLEQTMIELKRLQELQLAQLSLALDKQPEALQQGRIRRRSDAITRVFDDYRVWVRDTLNTEPSPWIHALAGACNAI
jgi:superfamily II DNA or RNA helicase